MLVWINGKLVEGDKAVVSVFDAGFQHGVGLFETMCGRNGRIFRGDRHMHRLMNSARELRLTERLHGEPLLEAAELTMRRNELDDARVRLTLTGGDLNMLQSEGAGPSDPTIVIVAQPPTPYPPQLFERGVLAVIADHRVSPLMPDAGHKTLNYWPRIAALQLATMRQAGESLWFSVSNHLCSGSVSNVFIVKDGRLLTPLAHGEEPDGALPMAVLPGITREAVLECAQHDGIETEQRMLDINDLLSADEVFLTNSSWGVLPVIAVERESIGAGTVGPMTRALRESWLDAVEEETAGL